MPIKIALAFSDEEELMNSLLQHVIEAMPDYYLTEFTSPMAADLVISDQMDVILDAAIAGKATFHFCLNGCREDSTHAPMLGTLSIVAHPDREGFVEAFPGHMKRFREGFERV